MNPDDMIELENEVADLQTEIDGLRSRYNELLDVLKNLHEALQIRHYVNVSPELQAAHSKAYQTIVKAEGI